MDVVTTSASSEVALLSIYAALGFFGSEPALSDAEADEYGGHIGASSRCVEVAQELALAVIANESTWPDIEYPRVLAHEVAEDAGRRLRAGGRTGDQRVETVEALVAFFKPDARTNADVDAVALRDVVRSRCGVWFRPDARKPARHKSL